MVWLNIGTTKTLVKNAFKTNSANVTDVQKMLNFFDGIKTVVITDLNGKKLKAVTTNQYEISLSEFSAGEYLVTVFANGNEVITTQRIVVVR